MADRFYTPEPLTPGEFILTGQEAHHLATVRRFGRGDRVVLFNGDGNEYPAEIVAAGRRNVVLTVLSGEAVNRERPHALTIAAALPKGDRGEFLVEKLVELGVSRFIPLRTERTVVQPREARLENLQRVVIEASKQCGRNVLMAIDPLTPWQTALGAADSASRIVLHPDGAAMPSVGMDCTIGIGPEGGFTAGEIMAAVSAGWQRVSLGPRILRVETAAIAAAALAASCREIE
ncbi:MAG TPA: 16S rRNA (uracil(1498)-N(3))-methyltransferase [Urbifossiella sp.]|nr:16S rRNA (uracil(1498)-N(3))-methyltransferase [Urbifossiella sp.]